MPFEELDLTGMRLETVEWEGAVLSASFGRGFGADAVVGGEEGLHVWSMHSGGSWPDFDDWGLTIDSKTRFEYYWDFFKRHTTGTTRVFIIAWQNKHYHAQFVETKMSADKMAKRLEIYEAGIPIRQRRIVGEAYNDDGSIDEPLPTVPGDFEGVQTGEDSIMWSWTESEDI